MAKCLWWWANARWRNCHKIVNSWQFRQEVFLLWSHIPLTVFVYFSWKEKTKQHWSLIHWPYVQVHFIVWCPARRDAFSLEFSYRSLFLWIISRKSTMVKAHEMVIHPAHLLLLTHVSSRVGSSCLSLPVDFCILQSSTLHIYGKKTKKQPASRETKDKQQLKKKRKSQRQWFLPLNRSVFLGVQGRPSLSWSCCYYYY